MSVVCCYRKDGSLLKVYQSARKAALARGINSRSIDKVIRSTSSFGYGYIWKRYDDEDKVLLNIEPYFQPTTAIGKKAIIKLNSLGNIIEEYESIKDCSIKNNLSRYQIYDLIHDKKKDKDGYIYKYKGDSNLNKRRVNSTSIIQFDKKTNKYIKQYKSIKKASLETGISYQMILNVLTNKAKSTHGYIFKYKDHLSK